MYFLTVLSVANNEIAFEIETYERWRVIFLHSLIVNKINFY